MRISQLATLPNLRLAWRRITTGTNQQYKRFYRDLYYSYEIALENNLKDLRQRLIGGSYQATRPDRIYVPKASGLHRPLTLLSLEDQIVLQSFANIAAHRVFERREKLQFRHVFSNIMEDKDSIFFFRKWQETYNLFQARIEKSFVNGLRWIGDFDLAAFYDTISHERLLLDLYPRTSSDGLDLLENVLSVWSSDTKSSRHGHGIPQGPIASDFLAECFLLPIDEVLIKRRGYFRYVDDVRFLGRTEDEVRESIIDLERHCRERGLIPQAGKFNIRKAHSASDVANMLPSLADPQDDSRENEISGDAAIKLFRSSLEGKPYRVIDKTKLRFVLYRAEANSAILELVLRLIPHHPEHADAFFAYIGRFGYRRPIERLCLDLIDSSPYPYIRGEAWHVLARYRTNYRSNVHAKPKRVTNSAIDVAKSRTKENFMEIWGVCHFLCQSENASGQHHSQFLKYQEPLIQALLSPVLPNAAFSKSGVVSTFLRRTAPEPGLAICGQVQQKGMGLGSFGLTADKIRPQVANTLSELAVISAPSRKVDPIAEILKARYDVDSSKSWHKLLGTEYAHALGVLKQADAVFESGRSHWLSYQNSFNQTIFIALQKHFASIAHPATCTIHDKHGQLVDYGVTLAASTSFSKNFPKLAACLRNMNQRRNHLPVSHPYEKKTATKSRYLGKQERNKIISQLRKAYPEFLTLMP